MYSLYAVFIIVTIQPTSRVRVGGVRHAADQGDGRPTVDGVSGDGLEGGEGRRAGSLQASLSAVSHIPGTDGTWGR